MAERTASEAVAAFFEPLRASALCITDQPMIADGWMPSARLHSVTFLPVGQPVLLDSWFGTRTVGLHVNQRYRIIETGDASRGAWTVGVAAYFYQVTDGDGHELFSYHWDPDEAGLSWAKFPHLHVSRRVSPLPTARSPIEIRLGSLHFPTEHVAFEAIVRMLILEFGVPARQGEAAWRTTLEEGEAVFRRSRLEV